ncbi:MAG: efflux RND transporter periplasmic adaptor subunit [Rubrivivax sp.]
MITPNTIAVRRLPCAGWAVMLVAALALAACGKPAGSEERAAAAAKPAEKQEERKGSGEALTLSAEETERAGIRVEATQARSLGDAVRVTATIHPDQDRLARVAPRVEGRITSAPAKLGDQVRNGQLLATLDSVGVGEAHAAWMQAQSELRIAEADFQRATQLNVDEIIPRKDFLRAQSDRDKAAAALRAAADKLRLLGGNPGSSDAGVSGFAVHAPFAGTVIEKKATLGELAGPGAPMFTIADLGRVWIQADLPEAALAKVRVGAQARVSVPAYPGESFGGRVGYIGAVLDKDKRTVEARIEVANGDGRLKPGMFATANIAADGGGKPAEVIVLPDEAVVLMQGQPTVFVRKGQAYEARPVEPGDRADGRTVIRSGIKPGDQVVTAGAYVLKARKLKSQLGEGP